MPLKGIEGFKFKDDLRWICPVHLAWCRSISTVWKDVKDRSVIEDM
jgi:hypothetical protein